MQTLDVSTILEKRCYFLPVLGAVLLDKLFEFLVLLGSPPVLLNGGGVGRRRGAGK
jgi:hypothetical protein